MNCIHKTHRALKKKVGTKKLTGRKGLQNITKATFKGGRDWKVRNKQVRTWEKEG